MMSADRLTTTEAVCRLCWHLLHGEGMTTKQAAKLIGYTVRGTRYLLERMACYLPLAQVQEVWILEAMLEADCCEKERSVP